jgi:hypothetical protein
MWASSVRGANSPVSHRSEFVSYQGYFCRVAEAARPVKVDPNRTRS